MTLKFVSIEEMEELEAKRCPAGWSIIADHEIAAPKMLVKGLVPKEGLVFIAGQSGSGKTFIAVDLSVALASQTASLVGQSMKGSELLSLPPRVVRKSATGCAHPPMRAVSKLMNCRLHGAAMSR